LFINTFPLAPVHANSVRFTVFYVFYTKKNRNGSYLYCYIATSVQCISETEMVDYMSHELLKDNNDNTRMFMMR